MECSCDRKFRVLEEGRYNVRRKCSTETHTLAIIPCPILMKTLRPELTNFILTAVVGQVCRILELSLVVLFTIFESEIEPEL